MAYRDARPDARASSTSAHAAVRARANRARGVCGRLPKPLRLVERGKHRLVDLVDLLTAQLRYRGGDDSFQIGRFGVIRNERW